MQVVPAPPFLRKGNFDPLELAKKETLIPRDPRQRLVKIASHRLGRHSVEKGSVAGTTAGSRGVDQERNVPLGI